MHFKRNKSSSSCMIRHVNMKNTKIGRVINNMEDIITLLCNDLDKILKLIAGVKNCRRSTIILQKKEEGGGALQKK